MNTTQHQSGQRNEGEGNKTAAREFNAAQTAFAKSGKVEPAAKAAEKSMSGPEAESLKKAEEKGRAPGKDAPRV